MNQECEVELDFEKERFMRETPGDPACAVT